MNEKKPGMSGTKQIILNVVMVLCIAAIIFCGVKIVQSLIEYEKAEDKYGHLTDNMGSLFEELSTVTPTQTSSPDVTSETTADSDDTETSQVTTTQPTPVVREEYRAIYEQLSAMKAQYPDLFGWIYIKFDEEHIINLPVMQGDDNNYYIDHAYDGSESKSGAIFVDYRNTDRRIDLNQNMIFYGHNMNNRSMFALVSTKYKDKTLFQTVPIMFYTQEGAYTFDVFSIYNGKAGGDYDTIAFSGSDLQQFCYDKQMLSFYTKNLTFDTDETVLTLVTCTNYSSDGRVIVHGVLDGYESFFD